MVPSTATGPADPNVILHWPRPGELSCQRPARLTGGAPGCAGCAVETGGVELNPGMSTLQPASISA
jgi:hypothetical protein